MAFREFKAGRGGDTRGGHFCDFKNFVSRRRVCGMWLSVYVVWCGRSISYLVGVVRKNLLPPCQ
jgi:hypothetical protein